MVPLMYKLSEKNMKVTMPLQFTHSKNYIEKTGCRSRREAHVALLRSHRRAEST